MGGVKMDIKGLHRSIWTALLLLLVTACGGGSGIDGTEDNDNGIEGTGTTVATVASGPIDNFGSVIVNGVRYDTDNAVFSVNNAVASQTELALGQVVVVTGAVREDGVTGVADRVDFVANIRGPVSRVDPLTNTLIVLDQLVAISTTTQLGDDIDIDNLSSISIGDFVEVSGLPTSSGELIATRVDILEAVDRSSVLGVVSNIDTSALSFDLNGLSVDFTNALVDGAPESGLEDGLRVVVDGNVNTDSAAQLDFNAVEIRVVSALPELTQELNVDVESLISRFASVTDFDVDGTRVTTNDSTEYLEGTVDDLGLNSSINVKGVINADNILVAAQIEFIPFNVDILVTGQVQTLTTSDNSEGIVGTLEILGVSLTVTNETVYADKSSLNSPVEGFADITPSDRLDVRGIYDGQSTTVTSITRLDPGELSRLRGLVGVTSSQLLLVQEVTAPLLADAEFIGIDGRTISLRAFLDGAPGTSVLLEGIFSENMLDVSRAQLIVGPDSNLLIGTPSRDNLFGTDNDDRILGGDERDLIVGGAGDDELSGEDGDDVVLGDAGDDQLFGGLGDDNLSGGIGDDNLIGGEGNDNLSPGPGVDIVDGGEGRDNLNYVDSDMGVNIDLLANTASGGDAEGDTIENVEILRGSDFDDVLGGNNEANTIDGFAGNDILYGYEGNDILRSHEGNDQLFGGEGIDIIDAGDGDDILHGEEGDDRMTPGLGADIINGGPGFDRVLYDDSQEGITVTLDQSPSQGGSAEGDVLSNVEYIWASDFDDVLTGTDIREELQGRGGNDRLTSLGGNDFVSGGDGDDIIFAGEHNDTVLGGAGDDQIFGEAGRDRLMGGAGADHIDGGGDTDEVSYHLAPSGVTISLMGTPGVGGEAEGDTLFNIEDVRGSAHDDTIEGNDLANLISGLAGNDLMAGGAGEDTYRIQSRGGLDYIDEGLADMDSRDELEFFNVSDIQDLWFSQKGDDLCIYIVGSDDRVCVRRWFSDGPSIEGFLSARSSSRSLEASAVQSLVDAMTIVEPVDGRILVLDATQIDQVAAVIEAAWD